ncbi:hypothetical protein JCM33374_g1229 [Metschnikowia sp. JCM 33374]|nr:hypothetical protein JCM33374_g1229 [Metschnikowia sp. JCM 33374]
MWQSRSKEVKTKRRDIGREFQSAAEIVEYLGQQKFTAHNEYFEACAQLIQKNGPFLVGVFRNQNLEDVFSMARECGLDFIQLHGSEDVESYLEFDANHEFGIIKRYVIPDHIELMREFFPSVTNTQKQGFLLPLLDSEAGGEGKKIDWSLINELDGKFLLAGGLDPENLHETKPFLQNVIGFDVSGGVENANGDKNLDKIEAFIVNAKKL